jgi:nicotinamide phosphoribosyltransferase
MQYNPLNLIDAYKYDHRRQYPKDTVLIFSNFTPRKSRIPGVDYVVFFGLQYYIKEYLQDVWNKGFFERPKEDVLREYSRRLDNCIGSNDIGVDHIAALHDLGYLPIKILALAEGAKVPIKVPPFVMWNTHPDFFWLVNYLETSMSASLWQMCTSATLANEYRKLLSSYALKTTGSTDFVKFQGHDFSFRGMSSIESAMMSGAGHLTSFVGTDTVHAIDFVEKYYRTKVEEDLIGCSVPATEHSVMCMHGKSDELETFSKLLDLYPRGIVSAVADSWDLWKVLIEYLPQLKEKILARNGKLVIRPDSGDPVDIICGDYSRWAYESEKGELIEDIKPYEKGVIEILWDIFGGKINEYGYKELDPHIGAIYGDSITLDRANQICKRLEAKGFASTNIVFGIGSYTYQYNTRDTQGWAMKATYGEITSVAEEDMQCQGGPSLGEKWTECREIFKDPITDSGEKKSAKGLIAVYPKEDGSGYYMKDQASWDEVEHCAYKNIFTDGNLLIDWSFRAIRERIMYH